MYVCMYVQYVCMHACLSVCMYVVCMWVCACYSRAVSEVACRVLVKLSLQVATHPSAGGVVKRSMPTPALLPTGKLQRYWHNNSV